MIGKLRRNLREWGVRGTLKRGLGRIRDGYVEEQLIVLLKDLEQIAPAKASGELRFEDLEPRHLEGLISLNRHENGPSSANRYFENSIDYRFHGFVALIEDELVGYYWWVDRDNPVTHSDLWRLGRDFELRDGDVYGSSLFLRSDCRGGGRAGVFLRHVETSLRDRGYRRLWGYVEKGNRPARWTYELRGYVPVWEMINRRLVFFRWRRRVAIADAA